MSEEWRCRRIRLDPEPGVDDTHDEDHADLQARDAGFQKMAERKDCCYRDTHDPTCAWDSLPERPLGQAEEVAAKYGLLHKRTERDSDPGVLPFEWRAFVEGLEQQRDRKTADCTEAQSLRILPSARPVPMEELEPHRIQPTAACPCQPQQ